MLSYCFVFRPSTLVVGVLLPFFTFKFILILRLRLCLTLTVRYCYFIFLLQFAYTKVIRVSV